MRFGTFVDAGVTIKGEGRMTTDQELYVKVNLHVDLILFSSVIMGGSQGKLFTWSHFSAENYRRS